MQLSQLNEKERLIVALLDLERMWEPFIVGTSYYIWDIRTMVRRWLDILWQEVLAGQMTDNEKSELERIADKINETQNEEAEEGREYPEQVKAAYLLNHMFSQYSWFLDVGKREESSDMKFAMGGMHDMIEDALVDKYFPQELELVAEKNSGVLYEISSIEADVELAKRYPKSLDEILKKKDEYHKVNILDKIFSDSGVEI